MSTVFVTGGTGLAGANICKLLIERGDEVRALVRNPDDATALSAIGVEIVQGDITEPDDVLRASKGCDAAIHSAALLGGASQNLADFRAVNVDGTTHVLDAGRAHGMRRVVALSTSTFFDLAAPVQREDAPVLAQPPSDPYTVTKLAAYREVHQRAGAGDDVLTCHPGAIYGPSPVVARALHPTSFNRVLLSALRGKIAAYLRFPVTWVAASDVASGAVAALDRGAPGARYWLIGRPEDELSTAEGCNIACQIAGIDHRVVDLDHRTMTTQERDFFGPTLYAIAEASAGEIRTPRAADNPTRAALGYEPVSIQEGMQRLVGWLRDLGRI